MTLDPDRIERYSRQLVIPAIGRDGQERLGSARVRVVGASGPAAPGLLYLVLAGVGTIWIDDPEPVGPGDVSRWLYAPTSAGQPRAQVAGEVLQTRSRFVRVFSAMPAEPTTAVLIFASTAARAVVEAERARKARQPHVVAEQDADGGTIVSIPDGAPCYSCSRTAGGGRRPAPSGEAAVAALAAQELILMLASPQSASGRRIDLTRGVPSTRATTRLPGCACGAGIAR